MITNTIDITNIRTPLNVARGVLSMYGKQFYFDPYSSVEANKATMLASKIRTVDYKHNVYDNHAESIYLFPPNISIVAEYVSLFWRTKKIKSLFISLPSIILDETTQDFLLTNSMMFVIIPSMFDLVNEYSSKAIIYESKPICSTWKLFIFCKRIDDIEGIQERTPKEYRSFLCSGITEIGDKKFRQYFIERQKG